MISILEMIFFTMIVKDDDFVYTNNTCYDRETGDIIAVEGEEKEKETPCSPIKEKVNQELEYSDQIIYGDLFRFIKFNEN